jgi:hypothetical protein
MTEDGPPLEWWEEQRPDFRLPELQPPFWWPSIITQWGRAFGKTSSIAFQNHIHILLSPHLGKGKPTMKQKEALRRQREHGNSLRAWLQDQQIMASKVARSKAAEYRAQERGVDRVPAHLKTRDVVPEVLVEHAGDSYFQRRSARTVTRLRTVSGKRGRAVRSPLRPGTNQPHHNPDRNKKRR